MRTLKSFCKACSNKILCLTQKRKKCINGFRCITCGYRYPNGEFGEMSRCREELGRKPGDGKISPCKNYRPRHWRLL